MTSRSKRQIAARQIAEVFRTEGYDGASMTRIAEATGLSKSSLYHHFPAGKEDMATAALEALTAEAEATMFAPLLSSGPPQQKIAAWVAGMTDFYGGGANSCILAAITLGTEGKGLTEEVKQAFQAWIAALADVLRAADLPPETAQTRACAAVEQVQGALIVARALGDSTGFDALMARLPQTLLAPSAPEDT